MKVREDITWGNRPIYAIEDALVEEMTGYCDRGSLEQVEADVSAIKALLAKFMARHISTVDDLNELIGYNKYIEVRE